MSQAGIIEDRVGSGDVVGPGSSTDNAIARFDGTTGKLLQNSTVLLDDSGNITAVTSIQIADGAVGTPSITFTSDPDTGFFRQYANQISATCGGVKTFDISQAGIIGDATGEPYIRFPSGSVSTPNYSFVDDTDTGMYRSGADSLGWATGGTKYLELDASGIFHADGGVSVDQGALSFSEDLIVNRRAVAGDITGLSTDYYLECTDTTVPRTVTVPDTSPNGQVFVIKDASLAAGTNNITITTPGGTTTFDGSTSLTIDANGGSFEIISDGTNYQVIGNYGSASGIGGTTGSTDNAIIRADGTGGSTVQASTAFVTDTGEVHTANGSAASCAIASTNDIDTGFYFPSAGNLNLVIAGSTKLAFQSSAILAGSGIAGDIQINYGTAGTATSPVYSFRGDTNTGMFRKGTDQLGFTTGGSEAAYFDASQNLNLTNALAEQQGGTGQNAYAAGDILYASAANTLSRRAKGTDGQYLSLSSGVPTWSDVALALVDSENAPGGAGVATIELYATNATPHLLVIQDLQPVTDTAYLIMEVTNDGGTSWETTGYLSSCRYWAYNSTTLTNDTLTSAFRLTGPLSNSNNGSMNVNIYNLNVGSKTRITGTANWYDTTLTTTAIGIDGGEGPVTGCDGIRLSMSSGNIANGRFRLFKIA